MQRPSQSISTLLFFGITLLAWAPTPIAHAVKPRPCLIALFKQTERVDQILKDHPILNGAVRTGNVIFFPATVPLRLAKNAIQNYGYTQEGRRIYNAIVQLRAKDALFRDGILYAVTFTPAYLFLDRLPLEVGLVTDREMRNIFPSRGQVKVFVEAKAPEESLYGAEEAYFKATHAQDPKAIFIRVTTFSELKEKLKEIAKKIGPIDLLEINAHGGPGRLSFAKETVSAKNLGTPLSGIFTDDAMVRVVSCVVGRNLKEAPLGETFGEALGKTLLDKGGVVVTSTRMVESIENYEALQKIEPLKTFLTEKAELGLFLLKLPLTSLTFPFSIPSQISASEELLYSPPQPEYRVTNIYR